MGETMQHRRLTRALLILGMVLLAAGAVVVVGLVTGWSLGPRTTVGVLVALQAANYLTAAWLGRRWNTPVWNLDAALLAAAIVLVEPLGVVVTQVVGVAVAEFRFRRSPGRVAASFSQIAFGACLAALFVDQFAGQRPETLWFALVLLVGVQLWCVACELICTPLLMLEMGESIAGTVEALRFSLPRTPFVAAMGYLAGLAGTVAPHAALFALPPTAAMVVVLAEHFRAERDQQRAEALLAAARAVHASIDPGAIAEAVRVGAEDLLGRTDVIVRVDPPSGDEVGIKLDDEGEQWLVAPADADAGLLAAIAAIGAAALDKARLVDQLSHQAVHDALTGLPNKVLFDDRVEQAIAVARRSRGRFAVVALDLDAFRKVNDSLGHAVGDDLLRVVADRLTASVRSGDTVARLSSDVFVLLLADVGTAETAGVLTEKLLAAVCRPIQVSGQEVFMTACAGLAFFPDDGQEAGHLLRNADSALHRAKHDGPGSYEIYAQGMNEAAHQRLARESELHQAVRRDELRVRYQPQLDLRTGRIVAVEALVRWDHPTLGMLAPAEFVPLAEESGLIVEVDSWVLRNATRQAAAWLAEGVPPVRVAVNLSARNFQSPERLVGTVRDVLADSGLPPALLELEVTEGLAVHEDRSAEVLQRLRDFGVSISVDDFGTGYSMLGRLHRFPVDRLKIDRSFVREIVSSKADAPIVSAIIAMARSLGMETVAEGVETLEQQTFLRNRSCDLAQGFLFSAPTDAEEIARLVRTPSVGFNPVSMG